MKYIATNNFIESYVYCRFKGYLILRNKSGIKTDYENLQIRLRENVKKEAFKKFENQATNNKIVKDVFINKNSLEKAPNFILNAHIKNNHISIIMDGLTRINAKLINQYFYAPILFHGSSKITKEQRIILELYSQYISKFQAIVPKIGIIWHGKNCKKTTVHINSDSRKSRQIQQDIKRICIGEEIPKLILNKHCQICEFQSYCHKKAQKEDNLSLIRGISEKKIKLLNRKGIFTVTQLSYTFRPRRNRKKSTKKPKIRYHELQALAIREKKIYILGNTKVPDGLICIYLDIESDPDLDFVYLIGLIIIENNSEKYYSFWANSKEQEIQIFSQFINEIKKRNNFIIFSYGAYEKVFIRKMKKVSLDKEVIDKIQSSLVNTLSIIYNHIYFPTYSNSLKDIAKYLGFSWTESDALGLQSIVWRAEWEINCDISWKDKLVTYNTEDCIALKKVTETIRTILSNTNIDNNYFLANRNSIFVSFVENLENLSHYHNWRKVEFANPEFDFINKRAYFDYQQERVYIRNSKNIRKAKSTKYISPNRTLPASERIKIFALECPFCKSENIINGIRRKIKAQEPRVKRSFDITFTPNGLRRRVIEYRTSIHKCLTCNKEFIPIEYQRLDKHFHGLKSWAIFQHVEHRIYLSVISKMLEDFFGIHLDNTEVYILKSLMASYYEITYKKIFENIISGKLIHIDETTIELRDRKGYIWAFTNLEEVFYLYRPSREGGFLHELLSSFSGILVSDFYSAYDGIPCLQQKCLIHLIRDLNQDLLNNPFDEELKSITQPFGILLSKIIETIDKFGLKKKHLSQYNQSVIDFFNFIDDSFFSSDVARALQIRLIKNRHKLFTFIQYDGIPWNNNNAEHAIKKFTDYRDLYNKITTKDGIESYLVLLSICQTCHYQGIDFLKFLLSKDKNIDFFKKSQSHKPKLSRIELYPEGFSPRLSIKKELSKWPWASD